MSFFSRRGNWPHRPGWLNGISELRARTPALPIDVSMPGSCRSTRVTDMPRRNNSSAQQTPTMPAPRTMTCFPMCFFLCSVKTAAPRRKHSCKRQGRSLRPVRPRGWRGRGIVLQPVAGQWEIGASGASGQASAGFCPRIRPAAATPHHEASSKTE
ncbi:hypothetical protein D3C85_1346080 [compost metagenome]